MAAALHRNGARVTIYDPAAMERARQLHPELTGWPEFSHADPAELAHVVTHRSVINGRNVLDPDR